MQVKLVKFGIGTTSRTYEDVHETRMVGQNQEILILFMKPTTLTGPKVYVHLRSWDLVEVGEKEYGSQSSTTS